MRIIVLGYIVRHPLAGMAWSNLQYLMGLKALGHDVIFIEDSEDYPDCYDPVRNVIDANSEYGVRFAADALTGIGFGERWAYHDAHRSRWLGPCADRAVRLCETADVLLNLCGVNPLRSWLTGIPRKILVDEDPAFTQVRNINDAQRLTYVRAHDAFFTFAENIGRADCCIPDDGIAWLPTRQPVVLDRVQAAAPNPAGCFTTVMYWQSTPAPQHAGLTYGMKAESFTPFITVPQRTDECLELAVGGATAPLDRLRGYGWLLRDPRGPTASVSAYSQYIAASKAEFSVAKHGYVVSRSGWFSERSVMYLATGRPVVVQNTGFSAWLPVGQGVLAFQSLEEAIAAIDDVAGRYVAHCRAAREIAQSYFDSGRVLTALLEAAFAEKCRSA